MAIDVEEGDNMGAIDSLLKDREGDLANLVAKFEILPGLGDKVKSWIGTGPTSPSEPTTTSRER